MPIWISWVLLIEFKTPVHCPQITLGLYQGIIRGFMQSSKLHATFFKCNKEEEFFATFFTCCALWSRNDRPFRRWYNFEFLAWLYSFELHGLSTLPYSQKSCFMSTAQELQISHVNEMVTLRNVCIVFEDCLP